MVEAKLEDDFEIEVKGTGKVKVTTTPLNTAIKGDSVIRWFADSVIIPVPELFNEMKKEPKIIAILEPSFESPWVAEEKENLRTKIAFRSKGIAKPVQAKTIVVDVEEECLIVQKMLKQRLFH